MVPEADSDVPEKAPWEDARLESEPSKPKAKASEAFSALLEKLLQQHLEELDARERHFKRPFSKEASPSAVTLKEVRVLPRIMSEDSSGIGSQHLLRAASTVSSKDKDQIPKAQVRKSTLIDAFKGKNGRRGRKSIQVLDMDSSVADLQDEADAWDELTRLQRWQQRLESYKYDMGIATLLCLNVLWMAFELQVAGSMSGYDVGVYSQRPVPLEDLPQWEAAFLTGELVFTSFFFLDVVARICILRVKFWKVWVNYVDLAVALLTCLEAAALFSQTGLPVDPILLRLVRIGKLARATRLVTLNSVLSSLELLVKYLAASTNMLFWSFCLLTFIQCVAGILASTLCREFIGNPSNNMEIRKEVFQYYGTFSRTVLSMFEILFANWGPPCRVLVENISEWFSVFFLLYRCVLGFAILNVVNAVFVQQTIKTASSDEELAYKQKERDIAVYTRKVKNLFHTLDTSGDGNIDQDEFAQLVDSPMLKFWMSQLELEYHDLLSLFDYLDNGDGEITLVEFIEGATRLRGSAKALDIWRMEAKVESLFDQLLEVLQAK
ncbi:unnamed protein product [Effrenium voratum]|nr:unnamed protein product [Effrenium voratum]